MFGIGTTEVLVILVVALLVIGPTKLPEVARALGKGMAEFRRMSSDVKRAVDVEMQQHEERQDDFEESDAFTGDQKASAEEKSSKKNEETKQQNYLEDKNPYYDHYQSNIDTEIESPWQIASLEEETKEEETEGSRRSRDG